MVRRESHGWPLLPKASRARGVEKPAAEEPSGHRFVEWVVRHPSWPWSRGVQRVDLTGGYSPENGGVSWPVPWVAKRPHTLSALTAVRAVAQPGVVPVGQSRPRRDPGRAAAGPLSASPEDEAPVAPPW